MVLCVCALAGLPAAGLWALSRWLKRRNHQRAAVAAQVLLAGFGAFCLSVVYSFYFPLDREFENEFEQLTGLSFPESGEVVKGEMSGLDLGGDYYSNAQIQVSPKDYYLILGRISADFSFSCDTQAPFAGEAEKSAATLYTPLKPSSCRIFTKHTPERGLYQTVHFLPDEQTITFSRIDE